MNIDLVLLARLFIILCALYSIIYTLGVIWRVEKKLDTSYKFFLGAIISFTLSEIIFLSRFEWVQVFSIFMKVAFIIFFLKGILEMRDMLRRLDGEIEADIEKPIK